MELKLMTYNIQHGCLHLRKPEHIIDLPAMAEAIRGENPDIVVLNEVCGLGDGSVRYRTAQAEAIAACLGYHCFFGRSIMEQGKNPYGNAVLSRYPIVEAAVIPIPDAKPGIESRTITRCVIDIEGTPFVVFGSHFGLCAEEHRAAVATVLQVTAAETLPFAFMGDLNMTPDDPNLAPLFEALASKDTTPDGAFSFPSHDPDCRIDYIFTSPCMKIRETVVVPVVVSDHRPVTAVVEVPDLAECGGKCR